MKIDIRGWTIGEFAGAYARGETVLEVIDAALDLLGELPSGVLIGSPLVARARADALWLGPLDPASLPLYGVPFVAKANIDIKGMVTTAGCPDYGTVAESDATVIERLRAAGAIIVGITNLDQFATGLVGTRSPYGTPPNALRPELVPGGSSSGSAVAVALGAVPFSLATDTAGSGRVPAALNGLVALKPTLGRVSTAGILPAVRRIDCPALFARSIADVSAVAQVVAGVDPSEPLTRTPAAVRPMRWPPVVGVPERWPDDLELDVEIRGWYEASIERLAAMGARVVSIDILPALELGEMLYGTALVAERTTAVGEAIGMGLAGLDAVVGAIISGGAQYSAVDAYRTEYQLAERRALCAEVWRDVDVIALPTTPILPTVEAVRADPIGVNRSVGRLTTFVNLADCAAVVVPNEPGVPSGLQLIAPAWHDDDLLRLGAAYLSSEMPPPAPPCTIVVVGAHLEGLPLHHQLAERGAWCLARTTTAPSYRLHALSDTVPPKPGLRRAIHGGAAIDVEVWALGLPEFASFVHAIPAPLCIGKVELADGSWHPGFLCEPWALDASPDITGFGGWRAYLRGQDRELTQAQDSSPRTGQPPR